jgi:hypothetical protein
MRCQHARTIPVPRRMRTRPLRDRQAVMHPSRGATGTPKSETPSRRFRKRAMVLVQCRQHPRHQQQLEPAQARRESIYCDREHTGPPAMTSPPRRLDRSRHALPLHGGHYPVCRACSSGDVVGAHDASRSRCDATPDQLRTASVSKLSTLYEQGPLMLAAHREPPACLAIVTHPPLERLNSQKLPCIARFEPHCSSP